MSINLGNAADNTWKRIRLQHVTLAAGLALAVSSAVAIGGWQSDGSPASSTTKPSQPAGASWALRDDTPQVVFYLVANQEQADRAYALEAAERALLDAGHRSRTVHVLMAATPEQAAAAEESLAESLLTAEGVVVSYVDLR